MEEPSVLDYVKSRIFAWRGPPLAIPPAADRPHEATPTPAGMQAVDGTAAETGLGEILPAVEEKTSPATLPLWQAVSLPWRSLLVLVLALIAQAALEPGDNRGWTGGVILFGLALAWLVWSAWRREWQLAPLLESEPHEDSFLVRTRLLWLGLVLAPVAYFLMSGNLFTPLNLLVELACAGLVIAAFWSGYLSFEVLTTWLQNRFSQPFWEIRLTPKVILAAGAVLLALFFRFYHLAQVPYEMNSDHAEKLLDIWRVLQGQTHIFFPNNGGREALQMYLVSALHLFFGFELNFMALKFSTSLVGFLALPFLVLIGHELGSMRAGWIAFTFAGVAYWPNVVSRVGLRLPFYFLFTAATLYFLIRGLRTLRRNDFILAGITLGLSFYGYTPDRILPILVAAGIGLFLLHNREKGTWKQVLWFSVPLFLLAAVLFLPMLRYLMEDPQGFLYRSLSRVGSVERPLPGPVWQIFLSNMGHALTMFSWDDGEVWTISVAHRPALDIVTGALFWIGVALVLIRYLRQRRWIDLFLLVSIPILVLPSVLALAFPNENPNLYRTGGAMIPAFLLIGLALDGLMTSFQSHLTAQSGRLAAWGLAAVLLIASASLSYDLVFHTYSDQYLQSAWNTSEMGKVIRDFVDTGGSLDNAYVVAFPYWVDTRLVGMLSGGINRDPVLAADKLDTTTGIPAAKLFLLKPEDTASLNNLRQLYPLGWVQKYTSQVPSKEFLMFFVPPKK